MALGFFRGSFEVEAAEAVLSSLSSGIKGNPRSLAPSSTTTTGSSSYFPGYAYANSRNRSQDDDASSVQSLGSQLSNMDEFSFENDGAMTNDSYDLLDLESTEEIKARSVRVPSAKVALASLHQWSLVEYDSRASRYRMHNLVQLFAEDEAIRMGDEILEEESKRVVPTSFVSVSSTIESPSSCPLGRELQLTWKRRFVRYYCMVVAKASHAYRFDGRLDLFDKERPNIESAMRLAHELTVQSIEQVREAKRQTREELVDGDEDELDSCEGASDAGAMRSEKIQRGVSGKTVKDSSIVDALLYSNLVVRSRFIFRARVDPRRRIQVMSSCLQLSRETRSLNCTCGNSENDPSSLLWDVDEAKHDRELWILDKLPSFEDPQPAEPITNGCLCIGIRELVALEALLLTDLGYASCDVADWIAGEYYYLESLRLQREVLGWSEHPQLAEVLNQLGICLSNHRGYQTYNIWLLQHAEKLLKGSLMMRARVLGENHPEYATSLNNLANFYKNCGPNTRKKKPSDNSSTRSVDGSEDGHESHADGWARGRLFGSDRGSSTSSDSAAHSEGKGELEDEQPNIEGMYRRSLNIREKTLGKDHPQVAQSLNNVALFLSNQLDARKINSPHNQGRRDEIIKLYDRALSIRRSTLGNASFETAATLNNIGNFKRITKDWRGAEEHIKEALKITDRYFNDISPRAARIFINLARVYRDQERYGEAVAAYEKAQEIRHKLFPGSREVGYCTEQIGKCLRLQGQEEEGKRLEEQGRQMKRMGFASTEGTSNDTHSSGDDLAAKKLEDRVNVLDVVDPEALESRRFNFPGKLLGERGVRVKKIEAIANCQVRYVGPWPSDMSRKAAYLQLTGPTEQTLERAREQCVALLRELKIAWEQFVAADPYRGPNGIRSQPHPDRGRNQSRPSHRRPQLHRSPPGPSTRSDGGGTPIRSNSENPSSSSSRHGGHLHRHHHQRARGSGAGGGHPPYHGHT